MICPMGGNAERRYGRAYNLDWCYNVYPPLVSSNATATDPSLSNMMTTL